MRRFALSMIVVAAAVLLSGCYVTAQKLPASTGPVVDEALVGAWRALSADGKGEDTYLHFMSVGENKPMELVLVDNRNWSTFQLTSLQIGKRKMFAVKETGGTEKPVTDYVLGFYEVKGDTLELSLINPATIRDAVKAHALRGTIDTSDADKVLLTGSPQEVAAYFAKTDMAKLVMEHMSRAMRLK